MILRHAISIITPMGEQIIPQTVANEDLESFIESLKAQGVDPRNIIIRTDIELEEGEYEISEVTA